MIPPWYRKDRKRWCGACDKFSGHPRERCPKRPIALKFVIIKEGERKMTGKWQKEVPVTGGSYWTATRDGVSAGLKVVAYDARGGLLYGGIEGGIWEGWWWSEPVKEPRPPSKYAWENS